MSTSILRALPVLLLALFVFVPAAQGAAASQPAYLSCNTAFRGYGNFAWEEKLELFLKAETPTSNPFLSTNAATPGASSYTASDVASGPTGSASALSGGGGTPVKFPLKSPMSKFWLNLSKPIVGAIYLGGTTYGTAQGRDTATWRIEIFQGTTRVGGVQCMSTLNANRGSNAKLTFWFRPEVAVLDPAQALELHITRIGGAADFLIGTGGSQPSSIEFRGWGFDPLGGTIALRDSKLHGLPPPPQGQGLAADLPGSDYSGLLPLLGLAMLAPRRGSRKALVALLIVAAVVSAGCLGGPTPKAGPGGNDGTPSQTPIVDEKRIENDTLKSKGIGALKGRIRDDTNLSIPGATVILAGSAHFMKTDRYGAFSFPNVTAGSYVLRIDANKFQTLERPVTIEVGTTVELDIQMARLGPDLGGTKPHAHPSFPESGELALWTKDFYLNGQSPTWVCEFDDPCQTQIPIDTSQFVIPSGTGLIEVKLTYTGVDGLNRMGIRIDTPNNHSGDQWFIPRASGQPTRIAIFPDEADPGHQQFTNWVFYAYLENRESLAHAFNAPPVSRGGVIHAEFKAFRGVYPLEPPHNDLWGNRTEIALFANAPVDSLGKGAGTQLNDYPNEGTRFSVKGAGVFVPPGSAEIRGTLKWESSDGTPVLHDWGILYKSAASPSGQPVRKAPTTVTPGTGKVDFVIKVDSKDVDHFYQQYSNWRFYPDDKKEPALSHPTTGAPVSQNSGFNSKFTLSATVYKDPDYVFGGL